MGNFAGWPSLSTLGHGALQLVASLVFIGLCAPDLQAAEVSSGADSIRSDRFAEVFPAADDFGPMEGRPPAAAARRDGTLVGYVFSTRRVIDSAGYSGKPIDILAGLDLAGRLTGAAILAHREPILVIGVTDADLKRFVA